MRKVINITADLFEEDLYKKFTIKQFDDIELRVKILNKGVLYNTTGQSVRLYCKKSDGTILYQTEDIVNSDNEIVIKARNQATTCPGLVYAELELFDENGKISTGTFTYSVSDKVGTVEDAIESIDEIYILEEIEQFIAQAKVDIAKYKEDALKIQTDITQASERIDELNRTINTTKEEAILEINGTKDALIGEVNTAKNNSILEINTTKTAIIEEINTNKAEINGILEGVKTEANHGVERIIQTTNSSLETLNTLKTDLEGLNNIAQTTKTELETIKNASSTLKTELENVKQSSSEVLNSLSNKIGEANISKTELENVLLNITNITNNANSIISIITEQNSKAEANILELNPLNVEANANIEELKALITEAKEIAIPALRAYIAEHKPAEDLTEVNRQLEELYKAVQELDIRFNSYYTKLEVDKKIDRYIGTIGEGTTPTCYASRPEPTAPVLREVWAKDYTSSSYMLFYVYKVDVPRLEMFVGSSFTYLKLGVAGTTQDVLEGYKWNGSAWENTGSVTNIFFECKNTDNETIEEAKRNIYYTGGEAIYEVDSTTKILIEGIDKEEEAIYDNYNYATTEGKYNINQSGDILNNPPGIRNGILIVKNVIDKASKKELIKQEAISTSDNVIYIRTRGVDGIWSDWKEVGGKVEIPEVDLSNYYNKIETDAKIDEKIGLIDIPDLNNYYTKEETTNKIKEEVSLIDIPKINNLNGIIGKGEKVAIPPLGIFDGVPEPPVKADAEYVGKIMYSITSTSSTLYTVLYIYNTKTYSPYYYVDTTATNAVTVRAKFLDGTYGTSVAYRRSTTSESWSSTSYAILYPEFRTYKIYYSDVPIYSDIDKTGIYKQPTTGEAIPSLDLVTEPGDYLLKSTAIDFKDIQGVPNITLKGDIETVLKCYIKDKDIYQEMVIEGITYTRKLGKSWTYNAHNDCVKKDTNIVIKAGEAKEPLPELFNSCPQPNISSNVVGEISFKGASNKYYKFYVTNKTNNNMFYNYNDRYIGFTGAYQYLCKFVYTDGVWTEDESTSVYVSTTASELKIYTNTLPVCLGKGATTYDKNTILKEIDDGTSDIIINNFDNVTETGAYSIEIAETGGVENSPITGKLDGLLTVRKADKYIEQKIVSTIGYKYARLFDGTVWSSWTYLNVEDIDPNQTNASGTPYITPSMFAITNENLRIEYGEYIVDKAKNSPYVADAEREYTDVIYLKKGGFKKVLGCVAFPDRVDFHYSMWININMLLVDPTAIPDCLRIYMSYNPPTALWKGDPWHPETGLKKFKYCVIGY